MADPQNEQHGIARKETTKEVHLDGEEHGAQLGEPLGVDGGDALHVLLGREHQLVVADVVGRVAQPVQCRRRVQEARHACACSQSAFCCLSPKAPLSSCLKQGNTLF